MLGKPKWLAPIRHKPRSECFVKRSTGVCSFITYNRLKRKTRERDALISSPTCEEDEPMLSLWRGWRISLSRQLKLITHTGNRCSSQPELIIHPGQLRGRLFYTVPQCPGPLRLWSICCFSFLLRDGRTITIKHQRRPSKHIIYMFKRHKVPTISDPKWRF